ncbi:hypothetical protein KS4_31790 [Poriferisphaera corsica]|uniref:Uncharacterized protein n=1 Tax=Poriferisphaera corsica TaxID=2528020 RepID=A0A517YXY9_9BACT|nr:hypothetical protein KS4_31790 [Poriferisphaera corsica]
MVRNGKVRQVLSDNRALTEFSASVRIKAKARLCAFQRDFRIHQECWSVGRDSK